jgi:hypothetical protein
MIEAAANGQKMVEEIRSMCPAPPTISTGAALVAQCDAV